MARRNNRSETQVRPSKSDDEQTKSTIASATLIHDEPAHFDSPASEVDNNMDTNANASPTKHKTPSDAPQTDGVVKKVRTKRVKRSAKVGVISQDDFENSSDEETSESSDEFDVKTKKFRCSFCNKMFALKKALKKHKQRDHSAKPGSIPCEKCTRKFHYEWQKRRHITEYHAKKLSFKCGECEKSFSNMTLLKEHAVTHELPFKCAHTDCGRTFKTNQKLRKHAIKDHNEVAAPPEEPPPVISPKKLTTIATIMALPQPEANKCSKCNKVFRKRQLLLQHIRIHDRFPLSCGHCGRGYRTPESLRQHEETHSMKYMCDMCELTFREIDNLREHELQMHAKEQPYKCPYCTEEFDTSIDWKEHIAVHSAPTFTCKHCSQIFQTMSSLVLHVQVHADAPPIIKGIGRQETITRNVQLP